MQGDFLKSTIHEWYDSLYRFAISLCKDPTNALDLTQNAFYKLVKKADTLKDKSKVKSWLFSTLHREFVDQYRHSRRFPGQTLESIPEPTGETDTGAIKNLDSEALLQAMDHLE